MALCIVLRILTFLSTSLPGPAPHCQPESQEYQPPKDLWHVAFTIDIFKGCGDLIFSSHTSLSLSLVISVFIYGKIIWPKRLYLVMFYCILLPALILQLILIIAARKHYTVDVVVACYTTPLVYYASYYFKTDLPDINDINENEERFSLKQELEKKNEKDETQLLIFPINMTQHSQKTNTN